MKTDRTPPEILEYAVAKGVEKVDSPPRKLIALSVLGGMYVALGFLAYLRVAGTMPAEWGSFSTFLGAAIFPVGLIAVLLGGGELITGNMLVVAVACFRGATPPRKLLYNWALVTLGNLAGAVGTAYFLGHVTGLTEGAFLAKTMAIAADKMAHSWPELFVSAIGCNIFVGLGVWLAYGAHDFAGKILAIWFPVTAFVAIGFQHVVANMFIIPAAIFSGESAITWLEFVLHCIPVYFGNVVGGAGVLGLAYCIAYPQPARRLKRETADTAPSHADHTSERAG